jgi:hypothetical protein
LLKVEQEVNVDVFVGNLPGEASLLDLHTLIGNFPMKADLQCCEGRDRIDRSYHYFIVRAANRSDGLALMARLNGREFAGRRIVAREYIRRSDPGAWEAEERRVNASP